MKKTSGEYMAGETLPVPLTVLFGREQELEALCALVQRPGVRLVTIIGVAGVGKTSLALFAGTALAEAFPDGVFLIALEELHSAQLVLPTLVQALGIREEQDQPLIDTLQVAFCERRCLLLLDNLEQIIEAASLLVELLAGCPSLSMLVTSREALRVRGEHVFQLLPLPLPDLSHPLEILARNAAIQLFVHTLQCIQPSFQLGENNAHIIAEICGRLDGLPLAIELAAIRCRLLAPQSLLERLERRLQVLTHGLRDLPERQQTLRKALAWSYDLLSAAERQLFRRLSVFVGGCTLDMIEQVCAGVEGVEGVEGMPDVLDGVTALLEKSLLLKSGQSGQGEERLLMLETVREYGHELLEASDECDQIRHAHAACYLEFAERAAARWHSAESLRWLERLEMEHANLETAFLWKMANGEIVSALHLGCALGEFWMRRGYGRIGYEWMRQLLARSESVEHGVRAQALLTAGMLARYANEQEQRAVFCMESLELFRALGDTRGMAAALNELGCLAGEGGRRAEARGPLAESLELYRRRDDRHGCAWAMLSLAEVLYALVENAEARALAEESLRLFRVEGDRRGIAKVQALLAFIAAYYQEHQRALALAEESLADLRALDDQWEVAAQLQAVAELALRQNRIEYAGMRAEESLDVARRGDHREAIARALYLLAQVRQRRGQSEQAQALFGESLALYQLLDRREEIALILQIQARMVFYRKEYGTARGLYEQAARILLECEHRPALIESLIGLGRMAAVEGQMIQATRLLGAGDALRESIGRKPATLKDAYQRVMAMSATPLSEQAFAVAWQEGRAMTPQEVFEAWERREVPAPKPRREEQHISSPIHLTGREIEVLRLMTMGLTNPQIAARLTISPVTVNTHVRSLYNKLGVTSRSAATRYAFEHRLI
jgi:predicted ATPase/DNA-binding CsgD family transcriptional regulator